MVPFTSFAELFLRTFFTQIQIYIHELQRLYCGYRRRGFRRQIENTGRLTTLSLVQTSRKFSCNRATAAARYGCAAVLLAAFLAPASLRGNPDTDGGGSDSNSSEAKFLELVDLVAERDKQLELLDAFVVQFPKYAGMAAIYSQIQTLCIRLKLWDRALAAGDTLLTIDPADVDAVEQNVAAAEGKNDQELVGRWRKRLAQLEPQVAGAKAAAITRLLGDATQEQPRNSAISAVRGQARLRLEAALFSSAVRETDPARRLELLARLQNDFAPSRHVLKIQELFFTTYRDLDNTERALPLAEAILLRDANRTDALLYVAQRYFSLNRDLGKVIEYSTALESLINAQPKPQELTNEQWESEKNRVLLECRTMAGAVYLGQEQWADADRLFRAALPLAGPDSEARASILTNLGLANYRLRKFDEALKYYANCAEFDNSLKAVAVEQMRAIKAETRTP